MLTGIKFSQLGQGDILIDKNWSYRNLWGLAASKQKLLDQFKYSKEIGFKIIYDSICPIYDENMNLTLKNSGHNSNIWPLYDNVTHEDRISMYRKEILAGNFTFVCRVEFPSALTSENMDEYVDFFMDLVQNPDFSWIENWTFFENPEQLVHIEEKDIYVPTISPQNYVTFLSTIRTLAKKTNPNVKIGGPGLLKGLCTIDPNNPLKDDTTFYHNWLKEAVELSLLQNIDFFTVQLRQEVFGLEYDYIYTLSTLLKDLLSKYISDENMIPIYSLNQGRQELDRNDAEKLLDQTYYTMSELLNTAKNGIIPIINCIADFPSNENLNPFYNVKTDGYGIFKFDLTKKPQFEIFKFIIKNLENYTTLANHNSIYKNAFADDITFINNKNVRESTALISVIWPKYKKENKIIILPNADQYCMLVDGTKEKIINPYEFVSSRDFIIVIQRLNTTLVDYEDLRTNIFKKYMYNIQTRNNLLNALPSTYNTATDETNFYKILRSFALDYSDTKIEVDTLRNNAYLDTAQKDAIYNNFGTLVNLEKQHDWDYEKYRRLIKGVIKSLLTGPTKRSIEEAANLFINYDSMFSSEEKIADIKIYELYENEGADPAIYGGIYTQFAFIVEVSKNIDIGLDQNILNRDLKYIVNILKPAHTLSFIVIILTGSENYRDQYYSKYGIEFRNMDESNFDGQFGGAGGKHAGVFGWKHKDYKGCFHTYDYTTKSNPSKLNSGILIGPRKVLQDVSYQHLTQTSNELYKEPDELLHWVVGCPLITNKQGHFNCSTCLNKENCMTFNNTGGLSEKYKAKNDKHSFEVEYQENYTYESPNMIYTMNKTRFITKIPEYYDGNLPIHKDDQYKPLGIGNRTQDGVHDMKLFKLIKGKEVTIRRESNNMLK